MRGARAASHTCERNEHSRAEQNRAATAHSESNSTTERQLSNNWAKRQARRAYVSAYISANISAYISANISAYVSANISAYVSANISAYVSATTRATQQQHTRTTAATNKPEKHKQAGRMKRNNLCFITI